MFILLKKLEGITHDTNQTSTFIKTYIAPTPTYKI